MRHTYALGLMLICACAPQRQPPSLALVPPPPAEPAPALPEVTPPPPPVHIDPVEQRAVADYRRSGKLVARKDGDLTRYVYTGNAVPVYCKILHVTDIALEPGEGNISFILGDDVRWGAVTVQAGPQAHISIKPLSDMPNMGTNLTVYTDKHTYYFNLSHNARKFQARIAFYYPDETPSDGTGGDF